MKLKKEFIVHEADGDYMLISTGAAGFSGIVRGNKTLGAILELLQKETTEEAVVQKMCERFSASAELVAPDVRKAVEELRKIGAIDG